MSVVKKIAKLLSVNLNFCMTYNVAFSKRAKSETFFFERKEKAPTNK